MYVHICVSVCVFVCVRIEKKKCWQTARSGDFSLPLSFSALSVYFQFQFSLLLLLLFSAFSLCSRLQATCPKNAAPNSRELSRLKQRRNFPAFQVESVAKVFGQQRKLHAERTRWIERLSERDAERKRKVSGVTDSDSGREAGSGGGGRGGGKASIVAHHFWPTKSCSGDCFQRLASISCRSCWLLLLISFITKLIFVLGFFGFLTRGVCVCVCVGVRAWQQMLLLLLLRHTLVWSILCANCLGCVRTSIIFWCLWHAHTHTHIANSC